MKLAPNVSLLWNDLPLATRLERAAAAGFDYVELWWPGDESAAELPGLLERNGLRLAGLNFDAGNMPAGDRGLASDPERREQLRRNLPIALKCASEGGATRLNLLVGLRNENLSLEDQLATCLENVRFAAELAAEVGAEVLIEAVNPLDNGPYLFTTAQSAVEFIEKVDRPNVRFLYDAYHLQRTEGNLFASLDKYWSHIGHVQIADPPTRNEPGTGEINFKNFFDRLKAKNYEGFVGLEYKPSKGVPEDSFGWIQEYGLKRGGRND